MLGAVLVVPLVMFLRSLSHNSSGFANQARVSCGKIDSHIAARGRVEGATSQEIKLASRVVGRLKEVSVNDGDPIRKGQVVAVLENNDLLAQVEQARASVLRAQAAMEKLQNGARPEERAASRAAMDEAQAAADNARLNYQRSQKLFQEGGIISQSVLDQAERDCEDGAGAAGIGAPELQAGDGAAAPGGCGRRPGGTRNLPARSLPRRRTITITPSSARPSMAWW